VKGGGGLGRGAWNFSASWMPPPISPPPFLDVTSLHAWDDTLELGLLWVAGSESGGS